jgi:disulfide bond formation protein DsbB
MEMNGRKSLAGMFPLFMLVLLTALLLAGCGGKSRAESEASEPVVPPATAAPVAAAPQGDPVKGQATFQTACVACHGPDATGVPNLGKSLHASESEFVRSQSDDALVEFIKVGRQPDDPANTTGIAMPPKGGNPAITDDDLYHIVAWIRTLE